jgi:hypothetical protein
MKISICYSKKFDTTYKFVNEMNCFNEREFNFISYYLMKKRKNI